ncbi:MAG TPA: hypothetical protein VGD68_13890, partial [Streptosporangiaceae bacterium]
MSVRNLPTARRRLLAALPAAAVVTMGTLLAMPAAAGTAHQPATRRLEPGNLLVSGSTYTNDPGIVAGQTVLPPGCRTGCVTATASGTYPQVFSNVLADPNFGVTASITLTELSPSGRTLGSLAVPSSSPAAELGADGRFRLTNTNAYSGNNGRAAIRNDRARVYYTAGNAGNGSSPQ